MSLVLHGLADLPRRINALRSQGAATAAAADEIAAWFTSLPVSALAHIDLAVRGISEYRAAFVLDDVPRLAKLESAWAALGLASMAPDGHVREAAIRELARRHEHEIPFLVLRANDWVPQVRTRALTALRERLVPARAGGFVDSLPLVLDLRGRSRHDHAPFVQDVLALLAEPSVDQVLRVGFRSADRAVRRASYHMAQSRPGVLATALSDPDPAIRGWAVRQAGASDVDSVRPLLDDPVGPLRAWALRLLVEKGRASDEDVCRALLDRNDQARAIARVEAARRGVDLVAFYRAAISENRPAAVLGMSESAPSEAQAVLAVLSWPLAGMRRAAVRALGWISGDFTEAFAVACGDSSPGVVGEARRQLLRSPSNAPAGPLRAIVSCADAALVARASALDVLAARGKWAAVIDLLQATSYGDVRLTAHANARIAVWFAMYNRRFALPTAEEIAAVRAALDRASLPADLMHQIRWIIDNQRPSS